MPPSSHDSDSNVLTGAALHGAKLALRRRLLGERDALPPEVRSAASAAIVERIIALPEFDAATAVLLTLAFRSEWNTLALVRVALAARKIVAIPRVDVGTRMLDLHALSDPESGIVAGPMGIPEPLPESARVPRDAIDFVLVPGVAFDLAGRRLGYGGGYYDRLLPLLSSEAARVAGAFELQLVDRVPAAPHDAHVDTIVTESRTLVLSR